ncbi:hypothetical protein [Sutcliffiella deserti]|uniref:hypothetical protein n=1 Tax=Sutcliffiella deserti TaxID=2875501 RepID=UPI001CBE776E|nr:hypothetical protein [Sutcliffiella deserti]
MKFEFKSFKIDVFMNSSSLNKGENFIMNVNSKKSENEGMGTIAGDGNQIKENTNLVKNQSKDD